MTLRTHRQFELKANGDVDQHQQMLKPQHPQSEYKAHSRLVHPQHQLYELRRLFGIDSLSNVC
jgi:hypothetical protein